MDDGDKFVRPTVSPYYPNITQSAFMGTLYGDRMLKKVLC